MYMLKKTSSKDVKKISLFNQISTGRLHRRSTGFQRINDEMFAGCINIPCKASILESDINFDVHVNAIHTGSDILRERANIGDDLG